MRFKFPGYVELDLYPRDEAIKWGFGFANNRPEAVIMLRLDDTHGTAQVWLTKDEVRKLVIELEKFLVEPTVYTLGPCLNTDDPRCSHGFCVLNNEHAKDHECSHGFKLKKDHL